MKRLSKTALRVALFPFYVAAMLIGAIALCMFFAALSFLDYSELMDDTEEARRARWRK